MGFCHRCGDITVGKCSKCGGRSVGKYTRETLFLINTEYNTSFYYFNHRFGRRYVHCG